MADLHEVSIISNLLDARMRKAIDLEKASKKKPRYHAFAAQDTTDRLTEIMNGVTGLGMARGYNRGGLVPSDRIYEGTNVTFTQATRGLSFTVDCFTAIMDSKRLKVLGKMADKCLRGIWVDRDDLMAEMLNVGFTNTSYYPDGLAFFSTAHTLEDGSGTTYSNRLTADSDITFTTLCNAVTQSRSQVNSRNLPMDVEPVHLLTSTSDYLLAESILANAQEQGTAERNINPLLRLPQKITHSDNPFLTDADAWFVMMDGYEEEGILLLESVSPRTIEGNGQIVAQRQYRIFGDWNAFTYGTPPGSARFYLGTPGAA